jgi:putative glutamine amidotransferase
MKKLSIVLALIILVLSSCSDNPEIQIAISKGSGSEGYEKYEKWLHKHYPNAKVVDLYQMSLEDAQKELEQSSGLLLSGGPDVHPWFFGKEYDTLRCSIDNWRDTLEFALIEKAKRLKLPVLGICRGLQILNVANGGSLIIDIPDDVGSSVIHQDTTENEAMHSIKIDTSSVFYGITKVDNGVVNSNHHQAIDVIAATFVASSYSEDGIIESIEYKYPEHKPFLLAVQWHPERLDNSEALSGAIANAFIDAALEYHKFYGYKAEQIKK